MEHQKPLLYSSRRSGRIWSVTLNWFIAIFPACYLTKKSYIANHIKIQTTICIVCYIVTKLSLLYDKLLMFFWNLKMAENQLVRVFYSVEGTRLAFHICIKMPSSFSLFLNEETLYFSYAQFLSRHNGCDFKNGFVLPTRTTRNRQKNSFCLTQQRPFYYSEHST